MSDRTIESIKVAGALWARVAWLHTYLYGSQRTRQGKVVTITGASAYVRTRRSGKPVMVSLSELTKVQPQEEEQAQP